MAGVTDNPTHPGVQRGPPDETPVEQHDTYLVLSEAERQKGLVRPVRRSYIHETEEGGCGVLTKMGYELAETYARDPTFYGSTYCVGCQKHRPVGTLGEFIWEDGTKVGS